MAAYCRHCYNACMANNKKFKKNSLARVGKKHPRRAWTARARADRNLASPKLCHSEQNPRSMPRQKERLARAPFMTLAF